jgi:predicted TPR repeat methyltransferase
VASNMEYFDQKYEEAADPFLFDQRWYEERKRRITFACLPDRRYKTAFEPGCAPGGHTVELARRCDHVLAADFSAPGLARAEDRYRCRAAEEELGSVDFQHLHLPRQWPTRKFELILVAEILYYLTRKQYREFVERTVDSLESGGILLAVHWARRREFRLSPVHHHRGFESHPDLVPLSQHREQFILDVYGLGDMDTYRSRPGLFAEVEVEHTPPKVSTITEFPS